MGSFSMPYHRLATCRIGDLIPVGCMECYPGDDISHVVSPFIRLQSMQAPVMHPMTARVDSFFVPHRRSFVPSLDYGWEDFITGGKDNDLTDPLPTQPVTAVQGDVLDHLGVPPGHLLNINPMALRACNLIWNYWYRDQDLQVERALNDHSPMKIAWGKDYESTSRPWPQKGPDVSLPLGDRAPVVGIGKTNQNFGAGVSVYETDGSTFRSYASGTPVDGTTGDNAYAVEEDPNNPGFPNIHVDLSKATGLTVPEFRLSLALQRYGENRARWGSRFAEYILRGFRVRPLDARLQEPEFLGRTRARVAVSEVLQTAPDDAGDPRWGVGDLYGHGIASARGRGYRTRCTEHGYIISLLSVRPMTIYTQGLDRHWLYQDKEDYFQPELQFVGQQQVLQQEVFADGTNKDVVFGWSDKYDHLRRMRSHVSGEFRTSLNYWHLGREFATAPVLNEDFVEMDDTDVNRIFNDQTSDHLLCTVQHQIRANRRMAQVATPRTF